MNIRQLLNRYYCLYIQNAPMVTEYKLIDRLMVGEPTYTDIDKLIQRYKEPYKKQSIKKIISKTSSMYDFKEFLLTHRKYLNLSGKVLDIGCGTGIYSKILLQPDSPTKKMKYEGCEIDQRLVDLATAIYPQYNFFTSHIEKINKKDNSYEITLASGVLQYSLTSWKEAITELTRVTKNYIILARLPLLKYSSSKFVEQKVYTKKGVGIQRFIFINRDVFENAIIKAGLTIVSRDISEERYTVGGVDETIYSYSYLIKK